MGITVDAIRVACDTAGGGTQEISFNNLGGLTPKACVFIGTSCVTDATAAAHAVWSFGAADDTREWVLSATDEDAQATTDADYGQDLTNCVWFRTAGGQATDGLAAFSSFAADKVTIAWSNYPAAAYLLTVWAFAGSDLSTYAYWKDLTDTVDAAIDITDPGFTPDNVICATTMGADGTHKYIGLGIVDWDGAAVVQRAVSVVSMTGQGTSICGGRCQADAGIVQSKTGGAMDWYGVFAGFDANGFTVTVTNDGANNQELCYLALNYNSAVSHEIITHSTPTATGSDAEAGLSFTPQAVLLVQTFMEAVNTQYFDNKPGSIGVAAVTANVQYANSVQSEDGQATSDTQSMSDDVAVRIEDDDGSAGLAAAFTSFDANGWTFNYTATEAAAKLFFALAIGSGAAPAGNPWYAYAQM